MEPKILRDKQNTREFFKKACVKTHDNYEEFVELSLYLMNKYKIKQGSCQCSDYGFHGEQFIEGTISGIYFRLDAPSVLDCLKMVEALIDNRLSCEHKNITYRDDGYGICNNCKCSGFSAKYEDLKEYAIANDKFKSSNNKKLFYSRYNETRKINYEEESYESRFLKVHAPISICEKCGHNEYIRDDSRLWIHKNCECMSCGHQFDDLFFKQKHLKKENEKIRRLIASRNPEYIIISDASFKYFDSSEYEIVKLEDVPSVNRLCSYGVNISSIKNPEIYGCDVLISEISLLRFRDKAKRLGITESEALKSIANYILELAKHGKVALEKENSVEIFSFSDGKLTAETVEPKDKNNEIMKKQLESIIEKF